MSIDAFSATYAEARAKFRAAVDAAGLAVEVYTAAERGPSGEILATDVAGHRLKGAKRLLILQSGTHGVEGYCGSGAQVALLREGLAQRLPEGCGLMMIHAINPHGFAHDRRVTVGNIDLNRNFVDFAAPPPRSAEYEALADAIAPAALDETTLAAADARLRDFARARGAAALQSAITRGQFTHPDGLYYGGAAPTWSRLTFEGIMNRLPDTARQIAFIDFHTGLGPEGHGELITEDAPSTAAYARARSWWGPSVKSTVSGESVSAHLVGTIDAGIAWLLRDREVTSLALEYGTVPSNEVFAALRADNWLYAHGDPAGPEAKAIKARIRAAFYVDTDAWKTRILERAREVVDQGLTGLNA